MPRLKPAAEHKYREDQSVDMFLAELEFTTKSQHYTIRINILAKKSINEGTFDQYHINRVLLMGMVMSGVKMTLNDRLICSNRSVCHSLRLMLVVFVIADGKGIIYG
jgi:hypothetical protein